MKKILAILICASMLLFLVSCIDVSEEINALDKAVSSLEEASDMLEELEEELEDIDESINSEKVESKVEVEEKAESSATTQSDKAWKTFLKEYDEWVTKYLEITKKYTQNPADFSILSEYSKLVSEMSNWSERANNVQAELENVSPSEALEYSAELLKIAARLADAYGY